MNLLLFALLLFLPGALVAEESPAEGVIMEAEAVLRKDLPDGFPVLMLNEDFAVLGVKIENRTDSSFTLDVEKIEVYSKKDDLLEKALSTEITPTIVKYYRGKPNAIYAQRRYGYPYPGSYPGRGHVRSMVSVPESGGGRKVRATIGQEVREIVESFQLKSVEVPPGHYVEGYIYLKSKDSGNKLSGGHVRLNELGARF